jgi:hypothetical protein
LSNPRTRIRTASVAFLVALLVSCAMALRAPDTVQGDERGFLYYGNMQAELFVGCVRGDDEACQDWRWHEPYDGYGSHNPKLGMYLLGAADHATRGLARERRVPAMRLIWGVMAALCVAGMAWLGAGGRALAGGTVGALLLLLHPVFRASQVALLPDLPMLVFVLGALICAQAGLVSRGARQGLWLLDAGMLMMLAIACKLYALALVPVLLLAPLLAWRQVGWRGWLGLLVGVLVGVAIFVALTPPLWHSPVEALQAMTTGHVAAQQGSLTGLGSGAASLRYLAWLPFSLFLVPALSWRSEIAGLGPLWLSWAGVVLCALGLLMHLQRRRWLPVLLLVSSFAVTAWVITRFEPSWLYPRAFLLPSVAAVWLASCMLDALGGRRGAG